MEFSDRNVRMPTNSRLSLMLCMGELKKEYRYGGWVVKSKATAPTSLMML